MFESVGMQRIHYTESSSTQYLFAEIENSHGTSEAIFSLTYDFSCS